MFKKITVFLFPLLIFLLPVETNAHKDTLSNALTWIVGADFGYGYLSTQESNLFFPVSHSNPATNPPEIEKQSHDIGHWVGSAHLGRVFSITDALTAGLEIGYILRAVTICGF